ncbi:MAG: hypothetical protein WCP89_04600 [archaeon]
MVQQQKGMLKRLKNKGVKVRDSAKSIILSKYYKPTEGIERCLAIFSTKDFLTNSIYTEEIREKASEFHLYLPKLETVLLVAEKYKYEETIKRKLGFSYLVFFHRPVKDPKGLPCLLAIDSNGVSDYYDKGGTPWDEYGGFVFEA